MALIHTSFYSQYNSYHTDMDVILPDNITQDKLPALYLLHDLGENQTTWQRKTSVERYALKHQIAVIMPSGLDNWYTDMSLAKGYFNNYFSFMCEELIDICHSFFPKLSDDKKDRFAAGNGMGGYGAVKLALAHPELYRAGISLKGIVDIESEILETADKGMKKRYEDIFGNAESVRGSHNDLFSYVNEGENKSNIYLFCGEEDNEYDQNCKLSKSLGEKGYHVDMKTHKGKTEWDELDGQLKQIIEVITAK